MGEMAGEALRRWHDEASEMKKAENGSNRGGALSVGDVGGGGRCGALIEAREADGGGSES